MRTGLGWLSRIAATAAAVLVIGAAVVAPADAASRLCRKLEAELVSTTSSKRTAAQVRKIDIAIERQGRQLQRARQQARGSGCAFLGGIFGGQCSSANATIRQMERNLNALERKRADIARGGQPRSRARIVADLEANGCRDERVAERRLPPSIERKPASLDEILGAGERSLARLDADLGTLDDPSDENEDSGRLRFLYPRDRLIAQPFGAESLLSAPPGEYQTLCVRTCDGYFFPMSGATSSLEFQRDRRNCETSCPGADIQLYYRKARQGDDADMISASSGEPYSQLPTAWLYKQSTAPRPANCGCNQAGNFSIIAGTPPLDAEDTISAPAPVIPADPAADPETVANLYGKMSAEAVGRIVRAPQIIIGAPPPDTVRVVGPVFLPDPAEAIDLRSPGPKAVP